MNHFKHKYFDPLFTIAMRSSKSIFHLELEELAYREEEWLKPQFAKFGTHTSGNFRLNGTTINTILELYPDFDTAEIVIKRILKKRDDNEYSSPEEFHKARLIHKLLSADLYGS